MDATAASTEPRVIDDTNHLGADAQAVIGSMFIAQPFSLVFRMVEGRPTPRMQAALDHLVRAGILTVETLEGGPAVRYRAAVRFSKAEARKCRAMAMNKANSFPITEDIL